MKMQAITAQFVQCQLCTNYSRHCFTPGCAKGSTHVNLTREGSEDLIKLQITEQRCQEWSIPLCISTIDFTKVWQNQA